MTQQRYESRPIECWQKVKELRLNFYKSALTARAEGKIVHTSCGEFPRALLAGLGDFLHLQAEPYGASCGFDPRFSEACVEAFEARGFARDLCSYLKNHLGSLYLDRYLFGGSFPRPDFVLTGHICDTHAKWAQLIAEHFNVPCFIFDGAVGPEGPRGEERQIAYLAGQFHDAIEWLERVSGRTFDDERFRQAFENIARCASLWAECCSLNRAVPAPLDQKSMFSFYAIPLLMAHRPEAVAFLKELRDETRRRVEQGIAALATERCRLFHDSQPPWNFLKVFRYLEKYGAVCIGGHYGFFLTSTWEEKEDGELVPARTPFERGVPLGTREELVRAYAAWHVQDYVIFQCFLSPQTKNDQLLRMMRQWKADGMIMHLNRGCEGTAFGQMENRRALLQAGYPVVAYEGNMSDKREFDEAQTLDRIEAFLQSLGLKRLED